MIKKSAALALMLTTAACATREAGEPLSSNVFGHSTLNNAAVMSGERDYAIQLAGRFAEEVPTTITFDFDSARLDGAARATLDRQAHWSKQFPEVRFRVYGHTDAVGSAAYNKRLGKRRAQAAVNYLVSKGISRARLEALVSYGETQPLIVTQQRERRNRRTVTEVSGFLKRHPTVLDGKYAQIVYREYLASAVPATTLTAEQSLQSTLE
ncbi:MAG: OmpA family protein [Rhodobacteraceae bacterium]|nr:OmpA family protein [Paracoccaceae bacterium]